MKISFAEIACQVARTVSQTAPVMFARTILCYLLTPLVQMSPKRVYPALHSAKTVYQDRMGKEFVLSAMKSLP